MSGFYKVISGFPGIGKSSIHKLNKDGIVNVSDRLTDIKDDPSKVFIYDSDSSRFPKENFPANYMTHISNTTRSHNKVISLVSSHDVVRDALAKRNIPYYLVYPDISLKDEYLDRYVARGNDEKFIKFISNNWTKFIKDIEKEKHPILVKLSSGQYLSDMFKGNKIFGGLLD